MISLTIDGRRLQVEEGKTILEAAREAGIDIPTLCYHKSLSPYGACRVCLVEIMEGGRPGIQASCLYPVREGLVVRTDTERVSKGRRMMVELLLARCPDSERIKELAEELGVKETRIRREKKEDCILCGLCVRMCRERMGASIIGFAKRGTEREVVPPFDRNSPLCMGCGACEFICPTGAIKAADNFEGEIKPLAAEFDMGLVTRPVINLLYPQAVPNKPAIDKQKCIHFLTDKCGVCQAVCEPEAIDFEQKEENLNLEVGAIIVGAGYERFNARLKLEYGYGRFKNVVTGPEFERILSASGPYRGHLVRPSDGREPKRIAFLQCVGSRDVNCNPYCSSVCCMFATKEAIVAKEHAGNGLQCDIYYMDVRAYGKGFDRYYERAKKEYQVNYYRCRLSQVETADSSDDLLVKFLTEEEKLETEKYDMVVLSTGLIPPPGVERLKGCLGLKLNKYNFVATDAFSKENSSREGVYVCGAITEPKDIPETVMQASAAAGRAAGLLSEVRGTLIKEKVYPEEIDVNDQEARIGVFVCHCGINISGTVNVEEVVESVRALPYVRYVENNLYTCSQDTQGIIKGKIAEHQLNRIVIASCTPRTHEPLFQDTIREAGLNPLLLEFVSIREQCSWVHMQHRDKATEKAKELVAMAVAKAALLKPLTKASFDINRKGLVVGGGIAGMNAALSLARQGFEVHLIEREAELGGNLRNLHFTLEGSDPHRLLKEMIEKVENNEKIHVHRKARIVGFSGYVGNYKTTIESRRQKTETDNQLLATNDQMVLEHGVVIVATGAGERQTTEYLYGKSSRVVTQRELEEKLFKGQWPAGGPKSKPVVMIQCVGSREEGALYCSRVCCSEAVKNALKIKEVDPERNIFILYRDIRTYGFKEEYYQLAREKGIIFINYDPEKKPQVREENKELQVTLQDPVLGKEIDIHPELLVLSTGIVPDKGNGELSRILKVPLNEDGFFLEAHIKLRPVDFSTDGIYLGGLCHSPKFVDEALSQAAAAAGRAGTLLSKNSLQATGRTATVAERLCAGCGICVSICPYEAREIDEEMGIAKVIEVLCQGCGACIAACPNGATQQFGFEKKQILSALDAVL